MRAGIELAALAWLTGGALSLQALQAPRAPAQERPRYEASTIPFEGEVGGHWFEDVSGDSLLDLVVAQWSRERSREIVAYLQRPSGAYPLEPDRRVPVKKDIVAFSFADVRAEPGKELIFFTGTSSFSFSTAKDDYSGNVQRLFQERFLWDVAGPRHISFLPGAGDLQLDGSPEILLPTREGFALFGKAPEAKEFDRRASFPAEVKGRRNVEGQRRRSIRMGTSAARSRAPSSELVLDDAEARRGGGTLLRVERWLPAPHLADANGDGRRDLMYLEGPEGERTLVLFLRDPGGSFPREPSWQPSCSTRSTKYA
jgi:hypothetical protein